MHLKHLVFVFITSISSLLASPSFEKFSQLKEELGITANDELSSHENTCHIYMVHHGDTEWTLEERLQGRMDIPLNDAGREQMQELAKQLSGVTIDAIYTSSLSRATESAEIIQQNHACDVIVEPNLQGESHGNLEGLKKSEYANDPHYIQYKLLSSEDRIFYSVGEGGLSKAEVARSAIPAIKEICRKHPGQNVVIVTHGGVLKFVNFLLGNYTPEEIEEVPHGNMICLEGDGSRLALASQ